MDQLKSKNNGKAGYTIIEVIISIMILAILLIAGLMMVTGSLSTIVRKGTDTQVLYQAQEVLEKIMENQTVNPSDYPKLDWESDSDATITMTGVTGSIEGTQYTVTLKETGEVLLTAFRPD